MDAELLLVYSSDRYRQMHGLPFVLLMIIAIIPWVRKPVEDFCHLFNMTVVVTQ